jgi:hypothetical protein
MRNFVQKIRSSDEVYFCSPNWQVTAMMNYTFFNQTTAISYYTFG